MKNVNQIIASACGNDSNGLPNSAITLSTQLYNLVDTTQKPIIEGEHPAHKPTVYMQNHGEFMQIDLVFPNHMDIDLQVMWRMMEIYGTKLNQINDESTHIPMSLLTICPLADQGTYYIVAHNPIFWVLQPVNPGDQATVIRLLYEADTFNVYEAGDDDIRIEEIEADVDRSIQQQEIAEKQAMDAQLQRAEYEEERNARLEEMKRNGEA